MRHELHLPLIEEPSVQVMDPSSQYAPMEIDWDTEVMPPPPDQQQVSVSDPVQAPVLIVDGTKT